MENYEILNHTKECPYGGDITNDCYGCIYSGEYHYDDKKDDCIKRIYKNKGVK